MAPTNTSTAREGIALKLTRIDQTRPEGVAVVRGASWTSPPAGWLPVQSGVCLQLPDGLHLFGTTRSQRVAILRGCDFATTHESDTGVAHYETSGSSGSWTTISTTEVAE